MQSRDRYILLLRAWALVFFVCGTAFLVAPTAVGEVLTWCASVLGLSGTIHASPDTLWHGLAISLMASIVLLSETAARRPEDRAPYVTLMTAKLVSTAMFLGLALRDGPAWLVCASGDAFVALTLFAGRRRWIPVLPPGRPGFAARWLVAFGAAPESVAEQVRKARARARRYPVPLNWTHPLAAWAFATVLPAALLRVPRPAAELDQDEFDRFLDLAKTHRRIWVRLWTVFVLAPLQEALTEEAPPRDVVHPLAGKLHTRAPASDFDVVVVGSGAGGAPVAWDLARRGARVAVVEAGTLVRPDTAPRVVEKHFVRQGMTFAFGGGGGVLVLAGSAVGGTTPVNSGTCLKPLPECLSEWDARLGTDFAGAGFASWLDRAWQELGVVIPDRRLLSASAGVVERGLRGLGREPYVLPRNAGKCEGSGRCCFGCPTGAKQSTDRSFLPRAVEAGAVVLERNRVEGIVEADGHVELRVRGPEGLATLRAAHVVLAAGAFSTPALIRRNGLGTASRLAGGALKVHPATKLFAWIPGLRHGAGGVPQGLGYRPPEIPRITLEGIHTPKSTVGPMLAPAGRGFRWWMDHLDESATFGMFVRERAMGSVREIAGHPFLRYRMHDDDARDTGAGICLLAEAFFAAGARKVLLPVTDGVLEPESVEELRRIPAGRFRPDNLMMCGFHPQGTTGIGRVVDSELRLLGTRRISVCDASVLPDSPGVNPQLTVVALSLRLAERLAGDGAWRGGGGESVTPGRSGIV